NLQAQQALRCPGVLVVVDEERGDVAVEHVNQHVAPCGDLKLVPVILLDLRAERVARIERADLAAHLIRSGRSDVVELPARREEAAAALFVEHAGVLIREVDVGLVALEDPPPNLSFAAFRQLLAAVLHARVARIEPELELQVEVADRAAAPGPKRVLLADLLRRPLPDDRAVLDAPERGIAIPPVE